jgi:murein DD-endopeptidase MepM/ murein hydrolase activator NlpD
MYEAKKKILFIIYVIGILYCLVNAQEQNKGEALYTLPIKEAKCLSGTFWENRGTKENPKYHYAIDIPAREYTPIYAVEAGRVCEKGFDYRVSKNAGYGNYVKIIDDNGNIFLYGHLESYDVKLGEWISKGQIIAAVGWTGLPKKAPHLHLACFDRHGVPIMITKKFGIVWKLN